MTDHADTIREAILHRTGISPPKWAQDGLVALAALVEREKQLTDALAEIANSYPWEPYDPLEIIGVPNGMSALAGYTTAPTNRRIARAVLGREPQ